MARGAKIVSVRIRPMLVAQIDRALERANLNRFLEPYNRSTWILKAVMRSSFTLKGPRNVRS